MERDMDLARDILRAVEQGPYGAVNNRSFVDQDPKVVAYHIELLEQAGLIEASIARANGAGAVAANVQQLTWDGHEFLEAVRNDTIWAKAKQKAGSASFELLLAAAIALAKQAAGL